MKEKTCLKCGKTLPMDAYYKHPAMGDGHLNFCKECIKERAKAYYYNKAVDEEWLEKERARGREKYKRLGYAKYPNTTREDFNAPSCLSRKIRNMGYDTSGMELHHWNYNLPYSVFLMSRKAHHRIHRSVTMNREDKYCYTSDGVKLETAEQAKSAYEDILISTGLYETLTLIEL